MEAAWGENKAWSPEARLAENSQEDLKLEGGGKTIEDMEEMALDRS